MANLFLLIQWLLMVCFEKAFFYDYEYPVIGIHYIEGEKYAIETFKFYFSSRYCTYACIHKFMRRGAL